jgi:hypothetical protein
VYLQATRGATDYPGLDLFPAYKVIRVLGGLVSLYTQLKCEGAIWNNIKVIRVCRWDRGMDSAIIACQLLASGHELLIDIPYASLHWIATPMQEQENQEPSMVFASKEIQLTDGPSCHLGERRIGNRK